MIGRTLCDVEGRNVIGRTLCGVEGRNVIGRTLYDVEGCDSKTCKRSVPWWGKGGDSAKAVSDFEQKMSLFMSDE